MNSASVAVCTTMTLVSCLLDSRWHQSSARHQPRDLNKEERNLRGLSARQPGRIVALLPRVLGFQH